MKAKISGFFIIALVCGALVIHRQALDTAFIQPAHAWGWCASWAPDNIGQAAWFDVTHLFSYDPNGPIEEEYMVFYMANSRFCMIGGGDVCQNNDAAISQREVQNGQLGDFSTEIQF